MRDESVFLIGVGVFFGIVGLIYWLTAYEDAGGVLLLGTCFLGLVPGLYYYYWYCRFHGRKFFFFGQVGKAVGPRPEDRPDATLAEGAGVVSAFPDSSIWPLVLGSGAFLLVLALVFGYWLAFPGIGLIITALVGVTAESRRGGHV
ncbi:MAG TPA: cytochrome c oxidase subunit 4 [Acidimicrobiales bacterium]|nr:cytochrome c oxidase subunit 4 [Acidimicrobiales bacterium]